MGTMHGCDLVFTAETAEKVKATLCKYGPCPCGPDQKCPMLSADIGNPAPCLDEAV